MAAGGEAGLREIEERLGLEHLTGLWIIFHDFNGRSCAKWVPRPAAPEALLRGGVFARANLNFTIDDQQVPQPHFGADTGDFFAIPDPDTFAPIPYRPGASRALSFLHTEDGELWEGCPRGRLAATLERLGSHGLSARVAFEPEFTLYKQAEDGDFVPADHHAMYSVDRIDEHYDLLADIETTLLQQHVRVVQIGAEYGAGQVEINLHHEAPLKAADDLMTMRDTVRALARDHGLIATFMPKPFESAAGNGLHVHLSLWDESGGEDRSTGDGPLGLSAQMSHFIGGALAHAPAICGVGAPTVNSYKRLQPASWAPAHIAYGSGNRSTLVRVPGTQRRRLEFRAGDHTGNPYLMLTALIAAGIDGLERGIDPDSPAEGDLGHADQEALAGEGVHTLPRSASAALDAIEADDIVMAALGEVCGPELLRIKRYELARYDLQVSQWERDVYLQRV